MSSTSMRLATLPLIRYSLSPVLYIRRIIDTSLNSIGNVPQELSNTSSTSAIPVARLAEDPAKITSSMACPRKFLALRSPKTHKTASEIFDFPLPFGPTIALMPGVSCITLLSANDLKPLKTSCFKYMSVSQKKQAYCFLRFDLEVLRPPSSDKSMYWSRFKSVARAASLSASFFVRPVPCANA